MNRIFSRKKSIYQILASRLNVLHYGLAGPVKLSRTGNSLIKSIFYKRLIKNEDNKKIIVEYLSDTAKENWIEGRTNCRF